MSPLTLFEMFLVQMPLNIVSIEADGGCSLNTELLSKIKLLCVVLNVYRVWKLGYKQLISLHFSSVTSPQYFVFTKVFYTVTSNFTIHRYLLSKPWQPNSSLFCWSADCVLPPFSICFVCIAVDKERQWPCH
jgi:hypothetical protein